MFLFHSSVSLSLPLFSLKLISTYLGEDFLKRLIPLLDAPCVPGTVLNTRIETQFILLAPPGSEYCLYLRVTDEKTEAHRG